MGFMLGSSLLAGIFYGVWVNSHISGFTTPTWGGFAVANGGTPGWWTVDVLLVIFMLIGGLCMVACMAATDALDDATDSCWRFFCTCQAMCLCHPWLLVWVVAIFLVKGEVDGNTQALW